MKTTLNIHLANPLNVSKTMELGNGILPSNERKKKLVLLTSATQLKVKSKPAADSSGVEQSSAVKLFN